MPGGQGLQASDIGMGRGGQWRQAVMCSDRASVHPSASMVVTAEVISNQAAKRICILMLGARPVHNGDIIIGEHESPPCQFSCQCCLCE